MHVARAVRAALRAVPPKLCSVSSRASTTAAVVTPLLCRVTAGLGFATLVVALTGSGTVSSASDGVDWTQPVKEAGQFEASLYAAALEAATSADTTEAEKLNALECIAQQLTDGDSIGNIARGLTSPGAVTTIAQLYSGSSTANLALRRAAMRSMAAFATLPDFPVVFDITYLSACVGALHSDDREQQLLATKCFSNLALEEDAKLHRLGTPVLSGLTRAASASPELGSALHEPAIVALAGCAGKHGFTEAEYVSSHIVPALVDSLVSSRMAPKEPRFACTALRELSKKASPNGPLEAELIRGRALPVVHGLVLLAPNVWTRRAACKAVVFMVQNPRLMAASGLSADQIMVTLEAAGKDDFMCARWTREAEKWRRGAVKKKWYE